MSEHQSQCELIKHHFDNGGSLTVLEAIYEPFRCYALSQRCGELKRGGYPVRDEWQTLPNKKRIKRYSKELGEFRLEA